jgi:IclR family KDG regulon transcriptional repressor
MAMEQKQSGAARVMAVLDVLSSADLIAFPHGMTVSDVARAMGRDKSVVSRQLKSLLECRLVSRDDEGRYELSWQLFALAVRAGDRRLAKAAGRAMSHLTEIVRERTYLTVLSDSEVLTVHSESSRRSVEAVGWVGRKIPVIRSSSGMALLLDHEDAHILDIVWRGDESVNRQAAADFLRQVQEARHRGYALADRTFDQELIGVAAPVRDYSGRIMAAVNISGPAARVQPHVQAFAGHLLANVQALQRSLWSSA